jgi:hypothetical protein
VFVVVPRPLWFRQFVKTVQLTREDQLLPQGNIIALLPSTTATLVAGSPERTPESLWLHVLEVVRDRSIDR